MRLDELDTKIVALLTADARTSNREVGRLLSISESAVRKRLKRLEQDGAARIAAVVSPAALGLVLFAFVRLSTSPSATRKVAEAAARLEHVSFVALTSGRFNVITLVTATGRRELADIIHDHMRRWDGVAAIETVEIVSVAKHRLDLVRVEPPDRQVKREDPSPS